MHQSEVKPTIEMFDVHFNQYMFFICSIDSEFLDLCIARHGGMGSREMIHHFEFFNLRYEKISATKVLNVFVHFRKEIHLSYDQN